MRYYDLLVWRLRWWYHAEAADLSDVKQLPPVGTLILHNHLLHLLQNHIVCNE